MIVSPILIELKKISFVEYLIISNSSILDIKYI